MNRHSPPRVVAVLTNVYPAPSHTFIRREIAALEGRGWKVHRFSHRRFDAALSLSDVDVAEQSKTCVLIGTPWWQMLSALAMAFVRRPISSIATCALALGMARRSNGRVVAHLAYALFACVLWRQMRGAGCTHVHAHFGTNPAAVAALAHRLAGVTYSLTFHGPHEFVVPDDLDLPTKMMDAGFIAFVSPSAMERFVQRHPVIAHKAVLVPCGLDGAWREEHSLPIPVAARLVFVGRLEQQKNPLLLIDAAHLLKSRGVNFALCLVGDGALRTQIEQRIAFHGLGSCVALHGWAAQDEVRAQLKASRALVLSSDGEGLPVAIMEAFAMGRPAIATDVGSVSELVETNLTGWLVPRGDAWALADAMQAALTSPVEALQALALRARERLVSHDVDAAAEKLSQQLAAAAGPTNRPAATCSSRLSD